MRQPYYLMRLLVCFSLLAANLHAEIATSPLTSQSWVAPNVVVTLDDSGSMHDECIPNRRCVGGINVGSVLRYMAHPGIAAIPFKPSGSSTDHPLFQGVLTYNVDTVEIRQQRSSNFNPTYYDPNRNYDSWKRPSGYFGNIRNTNYAPFDPLKPSETIDLNGNVTYEGNFCTSTLASSCSVSTQTFKAARYYVLIDGQRGNQVSDFNEVIIDNATSFTKGSNRDDCSGAVCTQSEERQNFANWFSYYRVVSKFEGDPFTFYPATYDTSSLFAMQMHSPDTNFAYYNPTRRYTPWVNADLSSYPNASTTAARYDPIVPAYTLDLTQEITAKEVFCNGPYREDCAAATQTFHPAQYYLKNSGTPGTDISHFTQVVIKNRSTFTKYTSATNPPGDRSDCATSVCTQGEELQNFANWFTYYRTKWLAAKAAISQTFKVLPGETRLGHGVISLPKSGNIIDTVQTGTLQKGVTPFNDAGRNGFYDWLLNLRTNTTGAGTPLRRAMVDVGNYYLRRDDAGPWAETPGGTSTAAHVVCRRALHLLITDGAWGGTIAPNVAQPELADFKNTAGSSLVDINVDGGDTTDKYPFKDTYSNTLADVAMYYWKTNLRPDLTGTVTPPQSEKDLGRNATWPHMVNYIIGFGVNGTLRNPEDRAALEAGTKTWPAPTSEATKVDDMWHAAWNSGGSSFNASDPKQLIDSLGKVIESMKEQVGSDAPLVLPSRFVSSDYVYIPSYKSKTWSGDLLAYTFDRATGDRTKGSDGNYADASWSAANQLKLMSADSRNIFTFDGSNRLEFKYASLSYQGLISLTTNNSAQPEDLINYLRGDNTLEGTRYRARPDGKLGDVVNSPPLLVLDGEDASYDFLAAPAPGTTRGNYRQFLLDKKKRKGLVFVGANDGMLHAFDAGNGDEKFAYIPKTVLGDVYRLSATDYAHRYYVDGPLVEADVYDSSITPSATDTGWRNIVVGTGGAGARNIFAIKVPVRSNGDAGTSYPPTATDILWEVNSSDAGFADLGFVLQKPAVGMMRDGTWVVVAGNGYVNSAGSAKLFIINALTGALIKTIAVASTGNNGLGGVRLVLDLQRQITAAYAGDLQGNLWKFDFSGSTTSGWGVGFGGKPLFKAKYGVTQGAQTAYEVQPITAAPAYLAHPQGGNLVVFGTGKLFELADATDNKLQTLYAVWDRVITGQPSGTQAATDYIDTPNGESIISSSSLVEQTMTAIAGTNYYSASNNLVNYPGKRGWFIQLNMSPNGLRLVFPPQLAVGKVFLQTLSPRGDAFDACAERTGKTVNFVLNPFTGSASSPTFDVNADGKIDSADATDSRSNAINAVAVASNDTSGATFSQKVGAGVNTGVLTNATGQKTVTGAKNALRRTWRQIINRPTPAANNASAGGG